MSVTAVCVFCVSTHRMYKRKVSGVGVRILQYAYKYHTTSGGERQRWARRTSCAALLSAQLLSQTQIDIRYVI